MTQNSGTQFFEVHVSGLHNCIVNLAEGECLCHVFPVAIFYFFLVQKRQDSIMLVCWVMFNWILPVQEVERGEENLSSLDKILSDPENFPTTEEIIREVASTEKYLTFSPVKYMFMAWILNFQVNLRKIISLEPHMKLERQVNEVRRRRKIVEKKANICSLAFYTHNNNKN